MFTSKPRRHTHERARGRRAGTARRAFFAYASAVFAIFTLLFSNLRPIVTGRARNLIAAAGRPAGGSTVYDPAAPASASSKPTRSDMISALSGADRSEGRPRAGGAALAGP